MILLQHFFVAICVFFRRFCSHKIQTFLDVFHLTFDYSEAQFKKYSTMSKKLHLQWNDFQDSVKNAFVSFREECDFADVTLACEDGHQFEVHKVVLAASSPFFENILRKTNHSHPLLYMRGVGREDLATMLDFLYRGEANIFQENLEAFLSLAEELKLKELEGNLKEPALLNTKPVQKQGPMIRKTSTNVVAKESSETFESEEHLAPKQDTAELPKGYLGKFQMLENTVISMMAKSDRFVEFASQKRGAYVCKVCAREGALTDIKRHIESSHLEGVSLPCSLCIKVFRSRDCLRRHINFHHKQQS